MTKAQLIEEYIKECFETYGVPIEEFFSYQDEDGYEDIDWTDGKGKINMKAVNYASELLGISVDEILTRSDEAMAKWWKKYPYLWHRKAFEYSYARTFYGKGYDDMRLLEAIFDTKLEQPYPTRFDYDDVVRRMIKQLKELNISIPGAYHEGATITKLYIDTENFCEYEDIELMTNSFVDMVIVARDLCLKAIHSELNQEEIQEYNFLTTVLGTRDRYYVRGYLRYNELMKVRELYADISEENFDEYIIFRKADTFHPWCCAGFVNNRMLVEKYLKVVPQAKGRMRQFADKVSQFFCSFIWSDAKEMEPDELDEIEAAFGIEEEFTERPKERTTIFVPKNNEELNGADKVSEMLRSYCRPSKLGGIAIKTSPSSAERSLKHITTLLNVVHHNNFIDWCASTLGTVGGGADE